MPDDPTTPGVARDGLERPFTTEGLSEGLSEGEETLATGALEGALPKEYQPYSDFPWDEIPEAAREKTLAAVKKFHGSMTRKSQEAAELRQEVPALRQKAEMLERLTADPDFNQWYNQRFFGPSQQQTAPQQSPPTEKLREFLDAEGVQALTGLVNQLVQQQTAPLAQRVEQTSRAHSDDRAQRQLASLRSEVAEKGWPDVDEKAMEITNLLQQRRATDVRDAYFLACREDIIKREAARAVEEKQQRLQQKAETSFSPTPGPASSPGEEVLEGPEATLKALRQTKRELTAQGMTFEE
jgi:hypothetical protein